MFFPFNHFFLEIDGPAVDNEGTIPIVVDRPAFLALWIGPGLDHFQDEEIVLINHAGICYLAFEIDETLGHERRLDLLGRHRGQAKGIKLVDLIHPNSCRFRPPWIQDQP